MLEVERNRPRLTTREERASIIRELELGLRPKRSVVAHGKRVAKKRRTKKAETSDIRAAVFARAFDTCEYCEVEPATDLHHALGRKKAHQAASNCLAPCRSCHDSITENEEGHTVALSDQAIIFQRLGLHATANQLLKDLAFARAKRRLDSLRAETVHG
jgi:hypothetical protein